MNNEQLLFHHLKHRAVHVQKVNAFGQVRDVEGYASAVIAGLTGK